MKISFSWIFLLLIIITNTVQGQISTSGDDILNYKAGIPSRYGVECKELSVQLEDEHHALNVYHNKQNIMWIKGSGTSEFSEFKYEYAFKNDTLVYAYKETDTMTGHWKDQNDGEEIEYTTIFAEYFFDQNVKFDGSYQNSKFEDQDTTTDISKDLKEEAYYFHRNLKKRLKL